MTVPTVLIGLLPSFGWFRGFAIPPIVPDRSSTVPNGPMRTLDLLDFGTVERLGRCNRHSVGGFEERVSKRKLAHDAR